MTKNEIAIVTALIALTASIAGIFLTILSTRAAEFRSAHREILKEHVSSLGEALHEIVATTGMLVNAQTDISEKKWRELSKIAQDKLKNARRELRYPLWGLDAGLRELSRLPDWTDHLRKNEKSAKKLLDSGSMLAYTLDNAIRKSYLKGRVPTIFGRITVNRKAKKFRNLRDSLMLLPKEERL